MEAVPQTPPGSPGYEETGPRTPPGSPGIQDPIESAQIVVKQEFSDENYNESSAKEETNEFRKPRGKPRKTFAELADGIQRRVHISNLPFTFREEQLRDLFAPHGVVESADIVYNDKGSRGYGFVTMSTTGEAERSMKELNGYQIAGRRIETNPAYSRVFHKQSSKGRGERYASGPSHHRNERLFSGPGSSSYNMPADPYGAGAFPELPYGNYAALPYMQAQMSPEGAIQSLQTYARTWARHLVLYGGYGTSANVVNDVEKMSDYLIKASAGVSAQGAAYVTPPPFVPPLPPAPAQLPQVPKASHSAPYQAYGKAYGDAGGYKGAPSEVPNKRKRPY
ncbi:hypothetical protein L596_028601 [Steinernema carpocapsae]|uniref:RRM domain-containing protein n=1 Tax=Steinernema carpocapsae TaxID=34508 RepID=A0A4U5LYV9_STECR|nr:hypothetical protein L596_028601 [Steinernema carpocapsae]